MKRKPPPAFLAAPDLDRMSVIMPVLERAQRDEDRYVSGREVAELLQDVIAGKERLHSSQGNPKPYHILDPDDPPVRYKVKNYTFSVHITGITCCTRQYDAYDLFKVEAVGTNQLWHKRNDVPDKYLLAVERSRLVERLFNQSAQEQLIRYLTWWEQWSSEERTEKVRNHLQHLWPYLAHGDQAELERMEMVVW